MVDSLKEPVKGMTIRVSDPTVDPTATDASGSFSLLVPRADYTLQVESPDYYTQKSDVSPTNPAADFTVQPIHKSLIYRLREQLPPLHL